MVKEHTGNGKNVDRHCGESCTASHGKLSSEVGGKIFYGVVVMLWISSCLLALPVVRLLATSQGVLCKETFSPSCYHYGGEFYQMRLIRWVGDAVPRIFIRSVG